MSSLDLWRNRPASLLNRWPGAKSIDRLFDEMLMEVNERESGFDFSPACDVSEDANHYLIKFDIPGVTKDQIKIDVINNQLTVSAERKEESRKESGRRKMSEIFYGSYRRSFTLPNAVDEKRVDAKYDNGVLSITVPKTEVSRAKQIPVH